ncbi:MAG: histidinol phosphate phosphatase domain-containing protein [Chloroflexi bacterium]|nr:histidinol phosphate phosphatase domain-containing protein [Chloroflexota bacterium]
MVYDFHTHTFLSDGVLSPSGLAREALVRGYKAIAITDHVGAGNLEPVLKVLIKECEAISRSWDILAIPGVEITHVPKGTIDELARQAKAMGAKIVVVHGETMAEPVEPGTNLAALQCPYVDVLAHPGLISEKEAELAAKNRIFLELSSRRGHSLTNGLVAQRALLAGANLVLNSDAHDVPDLLTRELAHRITFGAGVPEKQVSKVLQENPLALLRRLGLISER